ncbi:hypothetical protein NQ317_007668 [Molorchus minor]|uniref:Uncharacterized protein n=1 Tax=Molorchus minor TaxID=1323400 RepID=A0ABQ9J2P8_9CUCU|nr:hypothetical protein NQ317_007668 [Molorchus minor]
MKMKDKTLDTFKIKHLNKTEILRDIQKKQLKETETKIFVNNNRSEEEWQMWMSKLPQLPKKTNKKERKETQFADMPVVLNYKINKVLALLEAIKVENEYEKCSKVCMNRIELGSEYIWCSPLHILNALSDSILQRKWTHLPHILLLLMTTSMRSCKDIFRNVCDLIATYNPDVRENGLDQLLGNKQGIHKIM